MSGLEKIGVGGKELKKRIRSCGSSQEN